MSNKEIDRRLDWGTIDALSIDLEREQELKEAMRNHYGVAM